MPAPVRPAEPADAPAVARIWWEGWREAHEGRLPAELVAARPRETFDTRAAQRVPDTLVATVDDEVVGFVMTDADQVDQVFLVPASRGRGVAADLLRAGERAVLARGHSRSWLAVVPGNARARAFYARMGWRDEGEFTHRAPVGDGSVPVVCHRYVRDISPLVTVDELVSCMDEVTVLDVRYRLGGPPGPGEFAAGHVPGAAYVDLDADLAGEPGPRGRHPLPDAAVFLSAMRRAGVSATRPVVVYDDWEGRAASRCWWLLRDHGHPDVRVLDGGWAAWLAAGRPVERGDAPRSSPGDFSGAPGELPVVDAEAVPDVPVLIDARAPERYRGETEPVDPVAGHVPGAVNVPTTANLDDTGHFLPAARLAEVYAGVGAVPGASVATYCGSGVTACHSLLALEVAGIPAALYPGSWSEWVADPARPVATGPSSATGAG